MQVGDGLGGVGLHDVGDHDVADVAPVERDVQDGAGELAGVVVHTVADHELVVAYEHRVLLDGGDHAVAALLAHLGDLALVDVAGVSGLDGHGDGVVGIGLGVGGHAEQQVGVHVGLGVHGHDVEGAVGESAGLVKDDGVDFGEGLKVVGTFHEHADARGAADAAKETERHGDDKGARAAHHEKCEAAQNPVAPGTHAEKRRQHGEQQGRAGDGRGVPAGKAGDEVLSLCLLLAGVFHKLQDAAHRGLAERLGGAHVQKARHVDAARDDLGARLHMARHALAGEGGGVELACTFRHNAVDGDALAGLHHDDGADLDLVGIHLREAAVTLDVGVVGRDVHHGGDGLAALAHRIALEQLAYLVEQHDGCTFGHVGVGVGEEHHRKCAQGGHGHEEVLVEHLTMADVVESLADNVVAGDGEGDGEQHEARVHVARRAERGLKHAELVEGEHHGEDAQRDKDAHETMLQ